MKTPLRSFFPRQGRFQGEACFKEAVPLLQKAADMGDAEALEALGVCYSKALGVDRDDEKAFAYSLRRAIQGLF